MPAYDEDDKIILQLDENNFWNVIHKKTGNYMMGPGVSFKQKKIALSYAQAIIESFDLEFEDKESMFNVNGGEQNCNRLRNLAWKKASE